MSTITDWITAISTVIYTIFTFILVIIAWIAKNTWKKEVKQKKEAVITRKFYSVLNKLENFIDDYDNYREFSKTYKTLDGIKIELDEILFEYKLINNKKQKTDNYIKYFIKLSEKYLSFKVLDKGFKFNSVDEFWDDFLPSQTEDGDLIYTEKYIELNKYIEEAKIDCENKLRKFYN